MAMLKTLFTAAFVAMLFQFAMATNHTVGAPDGGWDTITDLEAWSSSQKFLVGDSLVFAYASDHNVQEVEEADYVICDLSHPISIDTRGLTTIKLTAPGIRYFICRTPGHCAQGMKLQVNIIASAAPSSPPPPVSSPPPPLRALSPSPPANPSTPPAGSPTPSKSNTKSPSKAPSTTPVMSEAPSTGVAPAPGPKSAGNKVNVIVGSTMGFVIIIIMLFNM